MPFYLGYDWHLLQGRLSSAGNGWDTVSCIQGTDNRSHLFLLHKCLDLGEFSFFYVHRGTVVDDFITGHRRWWGVSSTASNTVYRKSLHTRWGHNEIDDIIFQTLLPFVNVAIFFHLYSCFCKQRRAGSSDFMVLGVIWMKAHPVICY